MENADETANGGAGKSAGNRRHFLRCSGGATAASIVGWQLMNQRSWAGGGSGGSSGGSGGSGYGALIIGTYTAGSGGS